MSICGAQILMTPSRRLLFFCFFRHISLHDMGKGVRGVGGERREEGEGPPEWLGGCGTGEESAWESSHDFRFDDSMTIHPRREPFFIFSFFVSLTDPAPALRRVSYILIIKSNPSFFLRYSRNRALA